MREPSEEHPIYRKVEHDKPRPEATQLFFITCDEGWCQSIVCEWMYEWAADWLVQELQGKPYAPGFSPHSSKTLAAVPQTEEKPKDA